MKRLNFNHVGLKSLFVALVLTFMGAVSVSAQNYYPNGQAAAITWTELDALSQPPSKAIPASPQIINGGAQSGQADPSIILTMKIQVLQGILLELKHGAATEDAIATIFAPLNDVGVRGQQVTTVRNYVIDLLSN